MSSAIFDPTATEEINAPASVVLVSVLKSVAKYRLVPSVSTPVQELAPGTVNDEPVAMPVTGSNSEYVQSASPLLTRNLPLGRTTKPSESSAAGALRDTGPLTTAPVVGLRPKTC